MAYDKAVGGWVAPEPTSVAERDIVVQAIVALCCEPYYLYGTGGTPEGKACYERLAAYGFGL